MASSDDHSQGSLHRHSDRSHRHDHGHSHGYIDVSITTSSRGLWAVKWSFVGMFATAVFQVVIVAITGSVALLADTIHNFGDAATAIPLAIAFLFARKKPTKQFSFGYGRVEDLAGAMVVVTILFSACVAAYEAIHRLLHPRPVVHLGAVVVASIIGFLGNELVALFRIKVGKEIGSAALIADGYHARVDGWTSLAVLFGALGVWFGYPVADPAIGLLITAAILGIVWQTGKDVFSRALDGVDPDVIDEIRHAASHVDGVLSVNEVRARWLGHRIHAEVNVAVADNLSVVDGHTIANAVRHELLHHLQYVSLVVVHVDPSRAAGEEHHGITQHVHGGLDPHSH
jgi:cation diffusion facilitator family transporter